MLQNFLNLQVIILEMSEYICMEDLIDLSGVNQVLLPTQDTMITHFHYNKIVGHSFK
jgi:hypothetical protein